MNCIYVSSISKVFLIYIYILHVKYCYKIFSSNTYSKDPYSKNYKIGKHLNKNYKIRKYT